MIGTLAEQVKMPAERIRSGCVLAAREDSASDSPLANGILAPNVASLLAAEGLEENAPRFTTWPAHA